MNALQLLHPKPMSLGLHSFLFLKGVPLRVHLRLVSGYSVLGPFRRTGTQPLSTLFTVSVQTGVLFGLCYSHRDWVLLANEDLSVSHCHLKVPSQRIILTRKIFKRGGPTAVSF